MPHGNQASANLSFSDVSIANFITWFLDTDTNQYVTLDIVGMTHANPYLDNDCCDVAVAQINYPSFKHNTQDNIEQARGRSHEEDLVQIFMLYVMQLGGFDL